VLLPPLVIHLLNFLVLLVRERLRPRWVGRDVVRVVVIGSGSEGGAGGGSGGGGSGGGGEQDGGERLTCEDFIEVMLMEYSLCGRIVFHGRGVKVGVTWGYRSAG